MSYEHCDKHDQDATNGCLDCRKERVGDTFNQFWVGVSGDEIVIQNPPRRPITRKEALVLAAWLVSCASHEDSTESDFTEALRLVQS